MPNLGEFQILSVARKINHGYILKKDLGKEVLLPTNLAERELQKGENARVFIYRDGDERITATMQEPKVTLNHIARLQVKALTQIGAFLDWGLDKDLLLPHSEQTTNLKEGREYLVYLYLDNKTDRLVASMKIDRLLDNSEIRVSEKQEVSLWILNQTDLGYNVAINERHRGLVYHNTIFSDIAYGDQKKGYIKNIRSDNKIDVSLRPIGYDKVIDRAERIHSRLTKANGYLDLHNKSDPREIKQRLSMSKKTFKKAIGRLYKKDIINVEDDGIYLLEEDPSSI